MHTLILGSFAGNKAIACSISAGAYSVSNKDLRIVRVRLYETSFICVQIY